MQNYPTCTSRLAARRRGLQRPTLSLWTCFRAPPRSLRWIGPMSPVSPELRNSTSGSSAVHIPSLKGESCHFSAICIERSPDPGSSHFPPALLTRRPLTSPTSWVLWSRTMRCTPCGVTLAYQADVLKEMDEGTGLTPEAVKELRRATDLALKATKHTARAVGRSMAASVAAERHLWLNLTEIREKEKVFLMDAPISQSGLFGEAVSAVVDKFRSAKTQSAALKQFMPRRSRDYSTPSSCSPERSPLAVEPRPRALPPLRFGEPVAGVFPANNHASGLTWSGPTGLPLRLIRVVPDLRVGMRRAVSPLRGKVRPRKRFCPPRTRSPHLNLSQPPFEAWCADLVHPHFYSGCQLGDASVFPPLQPVHSPPAGRMLGDTAVSLLQCTEPVPATRQSSTSLSIILNKDAEGFPSRWRVPLLPGLLDTPSQVCLPLHDTLLPLSHFLHEWERLPGVSLWVLRTIRSGYTLQFGKNPPRFDGVHLTVVNSASKASVLQQELSSLLQKGAIEEVPQSDVGRRTSDVERGFFSRYFLVPKRDGGLRPILDLRFWFWFLVCHHRPKGCVFSHPGRSKTQEVPSGCLWREGLPIQGPALRPGFGAENVYEMHGCCTGPFEAPGHSCTELSGRLAHSGSLQGASESSQRYCSHPHPFSWPQDERQEECAPPISANRVSGGSFGFRSDAGPFGSCPDTQSYSMSGPLQARPACLCRYLPQAVEPHGSGLPCVAPRVASHEAVPLVDEGAEVTPHCTSYSPYQGVAQLLSNPFNVARPRFSPERGENGCDPPSPYDHDGCINDRLGRGLRRQTGEQGVEGRVPLLAYKRPGTQGCLAGFEIFSPRSRGVSYHSQDGQYGGCVPHKPSRRFTVAHLGQSCAVLSFTTKNNSSDKCQKYREKHMAHPRHC